MKSKIIQVLNKIDQKNQNLLYLVENIDSKCGFFIHENKFLFAVKNYDNEKFREINTDYLSVKTKIQIDVITNEPTFKPGEYNLLYFNHNIDDERLDLFINLCQLYADVRKNIAFIDFFEQMYSLFQKSNEANKTTLIGTMGELFFIKELYSFGKDLSNFWQTTGTYSKYDFVLNDIKIEVKTSTNYTPIFRLKHNQIFDNKGVYVVTVLISEDNSGISLKELIEEIKLIKDFKENFSFMSKVNSILYKLKSDFENINKKYLLKEMNIYDTSNLNKIKQIPGNIFNLTYDYNFVTENSVLINDFVLILEEQREEENSQQ